MDSGNIIIDRNIYGGVSYKITGKISYIDVMYLITNTLSDKYFVNIKKGC